MGKKKKPQLRLKKQTLAELDGETLANVTGGGDAKQSTLNRICDGSRTLRVCITSGVNHNRRALALA